jgi:hypothetical protein
LHFGFLRSRPYRSRGCEAKERFIEHFALAEDDVAKKTRKRAIAKRTRPAGKRDLVRRPKASAYAKRTSRGRFKEMDNVGRSQKADKPRKAKKTVRSGYGDQGDERPRASRKTRR